MEACAQCLLVTEITPQYTSREETQSLRMCAEDFFHRLGVCSSPFAEMGATVTSKRRWAIPGNLPPNLALLHPIQRGPLKTLLSISPTYGKMETQKAGKLLSLPC